MRAGGPYVMNKFVAKTQPEPEIAWEAGQIAYDGRQDLGGWLWR